MCTTIPDVEIEVIGNIYDNHELLNEKQGDKDKLIQELGEYKVKYTQEVLEKHINSMSKRDDERLRKTTIVFLKDFAGKGYENAVECINWLKKQDESDEERAKMFLIDKGYPIDANGTFPTYEEMYAIIREGLENQGKQESVDKVAPKFHKGAWVVFNDKHDSVYQIEKIENFQFTLKHILGGSMPLSFSHEDMIRAWTIQDAQKGDVLVDKDNNIGIYKEIEGICWHSYIYLGCDGKLRGFSIGGSHEQTDTHPATKEQRDALMKANEAFNITISKNKFGKFSDVRLKIKGSITTMSYNDYEKLVMCVLNPTFTNYRGEMYVTDEDYTSTLEKLRK